MLSPFETRGFTLIELLVGLTLVAILLGLGAPGARHVHAEQQDQEHGG